MVLFVKTELDKWAPRTGCDQLGACELGAKTTERQICLRRRKMKERSEKLVSEPDDFGYRSCSGEEDEVPQGV
uniref:Uncharacterized protein n=1 Tax=Timema tahoe TaxID=61484 RepID=A0A7R9IRV8_9NEOP|nr:unnamed protein product [Timema tahoe]